MLCPSCLSIMTNRDERHHVNPDSYRMNLHCNNNKCYNRAHMGVIVPPSYANQEWICDHYNIPFFHNKYFILRATPSTPTIKFYNNKWNLVYAPPKITELLSNYQSHPIIQIPFIPISTNNDMHQHATYIFNKLKNLIVFS